MLGSPSIALIFFSRKAETEALAKAWLGKSRNHSNTSIARLLISKAEENIRNSGFDVFHFNETQQRGKGFGEKLANAYSDVFAMGYSAAIAVGNDSPELGTTDWTALRMALENGESLLGPTLRGGAYLIGLQADGFDSAAFAALPWQTAKTYEALKAQLAKETSVLELSQLRDLNTHYDLQAYLRVHDDGFARILAGIFAPVISNPSYFQFVPQESTTFRLSQRGPPIQD